VTAFELLESSAIANTVINIAAGVQNWHVKQEGLINVESKEAEALKDAKIAELNQRVE
jgi:hypothetical protein